MGNDLIVYTIFIIIGVLFYVLFKALCKWADDDKIYWHERLHEAWLQQKLGW